VQKEEFNKRHPDFEHVIYKHSQKEKDFIERVLYFLINTQNGMDFDDNPVNDDSPLLKYFKENELKDKVVLVVGTGTGREMVTVKEMGAAYVCGTTLGNRNKLFAKDVVGVDVTVCDMHVLPYPFAAFDYLCGFQVLEHSYALPVFLLECHRVLKTGGIACFETPPSKTPSMDSWLHHIICPTPRQLCYLFLKTGFKPIWFATTKDGLYNEMDISEINPDEEGIEIEGFDDTSFGVCMKAVRQDPKTYERGDIRRYYSILDGQDFVY
ncbi:hypothetical protein LCGC14_2908950, partial [marine sediment metagenome]